MKPLSVVVAQSNTKAADFLVRSLYNHFRVVNKATNLTELRQSVSRHRADVVIVDLEMADMQQVKNLRSDFAGATIVCTHRLADERMWTEALAAGATDCCHASDVRAIVLAATQTKPLSHAHAA